jgi:hypothetical protein
MAPSRVKERIILAIEELPDDATFEDALERLYFMHKVEIGLREITSGEAIPHDDAVARLTRWHE